ncbi:MAG: PorP/SprF family type IX secretion system membrane protein [Bacteroidota bacterium]|nr:PorP/SprF family type IX secretion system membrane protein [Bacteroidota bacterium]MDP3143920.1 PorP/SprF family type IX secretion system membrane protein [Bacteroidota bacterium]MDP3557582.1 PorP/SprF family type IX secretion system membrane protein [Bacteroidota bacterium]
MKKLTVILILIMFSNNFFGQHSTLTSNYLLNIFSINPAYAGQRRALDMTLFYRKQWLGATGTPQTASVLGSLEIKPKNLSVGFQYVNDNIGFTNTSTFKLAFSYRVKIDRTRKIAFGIMPGYQRKFYDYRKLRTTTSGDAAFELNTPVINTFISSAGIFYYSKKMYVGISSPELLNLSGGNPSVELNLIAGYIIKLNDQVVLKPSVLVRAIKNSPTQIDINLTAYFNEDLGVGLAYRNRDAIVAYFDWVIDKKFKVGYAYDYSVGAIRKYNSGSHEIMLNYFFGKLSHAPSPRFF